MKDFMMLFHSEPNPDFNPTPEQIQEEVKLWQDWIANIEEQGKLKNPGEALGFEGKTLNADGTITDGPYAELKEIVGGYIVVTANNADEAIALGKGCPVLQNGGKVEVRDIMIFEDM